jgi:hypothetical protein
MASAPYADRRSLTFEQAEGAEPLPVQLNTKQLTQALRARLWRIVYERLNAPEPKNAFLLNGTWRAILYDFHTLRLNLMANEFVEIRK